MKSTSIHFVLYLYFEIQIISAFAVIKGCIFGMIKPNFLLLKSFHRIVCAIDISIIHKEIMKMFEIPNPNRLIIFTRGVIVAVTWIQLSIKCVHIYTEIFLIFVPFFNARLFYTYKYSDTHSQIFFTIIKSFSFLGKELRIKHKNSMHERWKDTKWKQWLWKNLF